MKKIIIPLVLLFTISFFACNNDSKEEKTEKTSKKKTELVVKGSILENSGKTLTFQKLTPNKVIGLDSLNLDEGGEFSFSDKLSQSGFYRLKIDNNFLFLIGNPGESITIETEKMPFLKNTSLKGSKDSEAAYEMYVRNADKTDKLGKISREYQNAKNKPGANAEKLTKDVEKDINAGIEEEKKYLKNLIENNEKSLLTYIALLQRIGRQPLFTYEENPELFDKVIDNLSKHHPDNPFTKSLKSQISKLKKQGQEQQGNKGGYGIGDIAPDIVMENPEGESKSLHSLRGQYVLLDFWAGWCRPCREENPNIVSTYNRFKNENFTIFQVSLDKKRSSWINAIKKDNLKGWTHVSDLQYWQSKAAATYNVRSIPANYLLDPEGKIIAKNLRGPALGKKLEEIFNK